MKIQLNTQTLATLALLFLHGTEAFSVQRQPQLHPMRSIAKEASSSSPRLFATVFYGDDAYFDHDDSSSPYSTSSSSVTLMESLSRNCMSTLARLACAFAPPGHSIHPKDLLSAHVMSLDDNKMEISAVLCEAGGCVSVAVPVAFPHSCYASSDMESCILGNLEELDHQAYSMIGQVEWKEQNYEQVQANERVLRSLVQDPISPSDMPYWWTQPQPAMGMDTECEGVKYLLNEAEFAAEIKALASLKVTEQYVNQYPPMEVTLAAVAAVGPSGIFLRAQVKQWDASEQEDRLATLNIPIPFAQVAQDVDDLRSLVLGLVEA